MFQQPPRVNVNTPAQTKAARAAARTRLPHRGASPDSRRSGPRERLLP